MFLLFESTHSEHLHFLLGEETPVATTEVLLGKTSELYAVELGYVIAKALEDTAHDTVLARVNLNTYLLLVGWRSILDSISLDITVIEGDTVKNLTHVVSSNRLVEVNMIYLLLQELRVSELIKR